MGLFNMATNIPSLVVCIGISTEVSKVAICMQVRTIKSNVEAFTQQNLTVSHIEWRSCDSLAQGKSDPLKIIPLEGKAKRL